MIIAMMRMTKKRMFEASMCLQNLGPDNKVYDGGDDDDSDGVRNDDDGDDSDYVDDNHDDSDDEEEGV